jgi:hypothetical protein
MVHGDVGVPDLGVEGLEVAVEQAVFDLELEVATCADGPVVGEPDLARNTDVQLHGHGL